MIRAAVTALAFLPTSALADFTENNLLAIFYHELGHAVIDHMQLPIFGQEEDAADSLSILLIDALYEDEDAEAIAYDSASLFWSESQEEPAFWDTHGPDEQRFYNTVCLFYGANPDVRDDFANELELPEERAEGCEDEFALASESWGAVLDELSVNPKGRGRLVLAGPAKMPVIAQEVDALNAEFKWPKDLTVSIESCGEPNAFYDLETESVTLCSEMLGWLDGIAQQIGAN